MRIDLIMVEEFAGCFIKISKRCNLPVTRYFIVDGNSGCLRYFKNSAQIRKVVKREYSWESTVKVLEAGKMVPLMGVKLGLKTRNNFSMQVNGKEMVVYSWDDDSIDRLFEIFAELSTKGAENSHKPVTSCTENDQSTEKMEISTLVNNNIYCGEYNDKGLPHGDSGKEICEDGSIYYGSFRNGKWHGRGCYVKSNLDIVYKEYIDGELCGI